MTNFGKILLQSQYPPWRQYYVDYRRLKHTLYTKIIKAEGGRALALPASGGADGESSGSMGSALVPTMSTSRANLRTRDPSFGSFADLFAFGGGSHSNGDTMEGDFFQAALDEEIEKCVLFFLTQQGDIASHLFTLRTKQAEWANSETSGPSVSSLQDVAQQYRHLGEMIVNLVKFAELNITAIRKILKKHDKNFHHRGEALSMEYLDSGRPIAPAPPISSPHYNNHGSEGSYIHLDAGNGETPLQQFYHFGGIAALACTLRQGLADVVEAERIQHQLHDDDVGLLASCDQNNKDTLTDGTISTWASECEPILEKLDRARARLNEAGKYTQNLAAVSLLFFQDPQNTPDVETGYPIPDSSSLDASKVIPPPSHISRFLNLTSAFLYMTNYYIVAPTSGTYASLLGGSEADTALIIGMTPLAAQFGAVLYSWWANKSYKNPLIFAAVCSVIGNVMYALALKCNSLHMVLGGRLLNGFGGARAINRRYIADAFRREERTAASAAFVTGGALGMAAGPFLSATMGLCLKENNGGLYVTVVTSPGWIMAVLWTLFFITAAFFFEEPPVVIKRQADSKMQRQLNSQRSATDVSIKTHAISNVTMPISTPVKSNNSPGTQTPDIAVPAGEQTALLQRDANTVSTEESTNPNHVRDEHDDRDSSSNMLMSMWTNIPVMVTLVVYFVLKMVIEGLLSSTPILTKYYFHWHHSIVGLYLSLMGLLMFPTNMFVARYSQWYEDRDLIVACLLATLVGIVIVVSYGPLEHDYTVVQYALGSVIVFCAANSLEGVNMSLLSKVIPKSWAKHGILNSGLLATESGTFGRTFVSMMLTYIGNTYGVNQLLDGAFIPLGIIVLMTAFLVYKTYDDLELLDDDDDEEEG